MAKEQDLQKKVQDLDQTQNIRRSVGSDGGTGLQVQNNIRQPQLSTVGKASQLVNIFLGPKKLIVAK